MKAGFEGYESERKKLGRITFRFSELRWDPVRFSARRTQSIVERDEDHGLLDRGKQGQHPLEAIDGINTDLVLLLHQTSSTIVKQVIESQYAAQKGDTAVKDKASGALMDLGLAQRYFPCGLLGMPDDEVLVALKGRSVGMGSGI